MKIADEIVRSDDSEREMIEIQLLLDGIYRLYGFDFRHYMRSSIRRRILQRMHLEKLTTITALLEKVLYDPPCVARLIEDFSIKVTEMFRDPTFFSAFRKILIPQLRDLPEIRIWHAGCATGEEAYSMAILMHEEGLAHKTKIYATDMNAGAIDKAKKGIFSLKQVQTFTKNYLMSGGTEEFSKYYTTNDLQAIFHPFLREQVMFAQHNLVTDCSFNEFHVILCRNVLIYFDITLQNRVHDLFYDSLGAGGFLCLGNKESLMFVHKADKYEDIAPTERVYRKWLEPSRQ